MKLLLTSIATRSGTGATQALFEEYIARLSGYIEVGVQIYRSEQAFLESLIRCRSRTQPMVVLLDSRGKQFSSEAFAHLISEQQASDRQLLLFGVGPADGWSERARDQASLLLSFGPMTLPHELARVVLSEQVYRAFTILARHPYHSGHAAI